MANDPAPGDTRGLTLALREADAFVDDLLELGQAATGADRVALLLLEDDGGLACRVLRGEVVERRPPTVSVSGLIREALEGDEPLVVSTARLGHFSPEWRESLGRRSVVLAPLHSREGPLGLLAFGWDANQAGAAESSAAVTAARSVATMLDAAISAEIERSRAVWREAALDVGREPIGRALAAIYLRAGLLRLGLDDDFAGDAEEIERFARLGLEALRRSEESLGEGSSLSGELFRALVELTGE